MILPCGKVLKGRSFSKNKINPFRLIFTTKLLSFFDPQKNHKVDLYGIWANLILNLGIRFCKRITLIQRAHLVR
jgi:hypothetical protein